MTTSGISSASGPSSLFAPRQGAPAAAPETHQAPQAANAPGPAGDSSSLPPSGHASGLSLGNLFAQGKLGTKPKTGYTEPTGPAPTMVAQGKLGTKGKPGYTADPPPNAELV